jgi:hypothetical protein
MIIWRPAVRVRLAALRLVACCPTTDQIAPSPRDGAFVPVSYVVDAPRRPLVGDAELAQALSDGLVADSQRTGDCAVAHPQRS